MLSTCCTLFKACTADDDDEEEDGDGEISLHGRAAQALHSFGIHIPSKHSMPPILALADAHRGSSSPYERRAVLVLLSVVAEGCQEAMAQKLESLLPLVFAGCADSEQVVREAACITIGQFAQCEWWGLRAGILLGIVGSHPTLGAVAWQAVCRMTCFH